MRISDWSSDVCSSDLVVAVDDIERIFLDQRQRVDHATARLQQPLAFVGDANLHLLRSGGKMGFKRIGEIMDVDDRGPDPATPQPVKRMIEERTPGDLDQRLGSWRRQRTHTLAESGGERKRTRTNSSQ